MTEVMNVLEARDRIQAMKPGDRLCYHTGFLLADREEMTGLAELADFMLRAGVSNSFLFAEGGEPIDGLSLGYLTQLKVRDFDYVYFFTKAA